MNGKNKNKCFVVTFHSGDTGYTDCRGVYKKFTTALGVAYDYIMTRRDEERNYTENWQIGLPELAEGENAYIVSFSYKEKDTGKTFDDEYFIIYDNRMGENDLLEISDRALWKKKVNEAKRGIYNESLTDN